MTYQSTLVDVEADVEKLMCKQAYQCTWIRGCIVLDRIELVRPLLGCPANILNSRLPGFEPYGRGFSGLNSSGFGGFWVQGKVCLRFRAPSIPGKLLIEYPVSYILGLVTCL